MTAENPCWYRELANEAAPKPVTINLHKLTIEERDALLYLLRGYTIGETTKAMKVSEATLLKHRRHVREKTGLETIAELTYAGVACGLTPLPIGEPLDDLIPLYEKLPPVQRKTLGRIVRGDAQDISEDAVNTFLSRARSTLGALSTPQTIRAWLALKQEADRLMAEECGVDAPPKFTTQVAEAVHRGRVETAQPIGIHTSGNLEVPNEASWSWQRSARTVPDETRQAHR